MSSASLAVFRRTHPDRARIAAISVAVALNLAVILVASRPTAPTPLRLPQSLVPAQLVRFIDPPPPIPPPPIEMLPRPHPPAAPVVVHPRPLPVTTPAVVPSDEGRLAAPPVGTPTLQPAGDAAGSATGTTPVEATLAYRSAPLHFPTRALQQRMQGTVMLRVLVDENGKPVQVLVEHGSGYLLLDRSAVEQVLAGWLFQPAVVDGRAVRAWARVPVAFSLRE
ncbi:energy transducer TonB [Rhodanobacter sp. FW510-R12]|uniref:energy transducer TonB n=1 Tax=unclassified Rhodanobacter TaxID=2621553 RepID=UPI0007AA3949|nr:MULTISPECIES: energy transducer TonB [unclassified Rhodanobacter]KZC17935.1 energy transducer TonB [Rhodanobacter sp. FW104-R8]KZC25603.1 energy transducer TonB [Rhodanobacter sp. FW510-T8]KZC32806.1 energy transducer TonB [Rhodanobacter sp. FW510-R10]